MDRRPAGARILTSLFWPALVSTVVFLATLSLLLRTSCVYQSDLVTGGRAVEREICQTPFTSLTGLALPIWLNVVLLFILPPLLGTLTYLAVRGLQRPAKISW